MFYTAIVTPDDGALVVTFPEAPGCVTQADAGDDVLAKATEALAGWLEASLDAGDVVLQPRSRVRAPRGSRSMMVPVIPTSIALRIALRAARAESGLTQTALARMLGISASVVQRLERGVANPTLQTIDSVAAALRRAAAVALVREGGRDEYGAVKRRGAKRRVPALNAGSNAQGNRRSR
jgi:transcriptional regulator with XRE-family HTH domain/predicted RNase H-like HicB family nuclease